MTSMALDPARCLQMNLPKVYLRMTNSCLFLKVLIVKTYRRELIGNIIRDKG